MRVPGSSDAPTRTLTFTEGQSSVPARDDGASVAGSRLGRYTVLERLGAGGMGEVYAAYDDKLDRKVALKLLRHRSEEYEARLVREAQAMARLLHPNVVAVFDTGVVGDRFYLAMEFVRGVTLREWEKGAPRSLQETLRVYREAGQGLGAAHAAGLVHRDFKPDNVLIAHDGRVKVTDFGIARTVEDRSGSARRQVPRWDDPPSPTHHTLPTGISLDSPLTEAGTLVGTPGYMAPEQFLCETVDARTDQYSFCVSLYKALYGVRPFAGGIEKPSLEDLAKAALEGKLDPPPKGNSVPAHVRRVLARGLSVEREARYPSMRELLEDLARDPARRRRRIALVLVAAATVALAGGTASASVARQKAALRAACTAEASAIYTQWGAAHRDALQAAMREDRGPLTEERVTRTVAALDAFATEWQRQAETSCVATRLAKSQSEEVYAKRASCLVGARQTFDAVISTTSEHDAQVHTHALDIVSRALLPPRLCDGRGSGGSFAPFPSDPAKRALTERARALTTQARVASAAGRQKEAVAMAEQAASLARDAGSPADEAAPLFVAARTLTRMYESAKARARAEEAYRIAERIGDDHTAAQAASVVALVLGDHLARVDEGEAWLDLAFAKLARVGKNDILEAELLNVKAAFENFHNRFTEAAAAAERGARLGRDLYGPYSTLVCTPLTNQGSYLVRGGECERGLLVADEAIACWRGAAAGEVDVAFPYMHKLLGAMCLGRLEEAVTAGWTAEKLRAARGDKDAIMAQIRAYTALAEGELGLHAEAAADANRVIRALEPDLGKLDAAQQDGYARALLALGRARAGLGDVRSAAVECERAVTQFDGLQGAPPVDAVLDFDPLLCLAQAESAGGHVLSARTHLERSLGITRRTNPGDLARVRAELSRVLSVPPKPDLVRAREQALLAQAEFQRDLARNPRLLSELSRVNQWLTEHPGAAR